MYNIGVTGYKGRLGNALLNYGIQPIDCDITDINSIKAVLDGKNFDVIINCAAYTNVDGAEKERIKAYSVNSFGPQNLAKAFNGKIIQLSTDYIFDGYNGPYKEDYFANPLSSYGFSKYLGEVGLRPYENRVLIVRTTILYDNGPKPNFVLSILKELQKGNLVKAPKYMSGNPTHVKHLAAGIVSCIGKDLTGIINIAGENIMSRFELAREIAMFWNIDPGRVLSSVAWGDARRPEKAGLNVDKAEKLGIPIYTLWQGLHEVKQELERIENADKINMGDT